MSHGNVAAIVVSHFSAATLPRCLGALLGQPDLRECVLVDNGSGDDWRAGLPADARLRCVANPDNPGFSVACNQGAARTSSPWLLFVNPDCFVAADTLSRLLAIAGRSPRVGILGALLVDAEGRIDPASRRNAPTPGAVLRGAVALHDGATGDELRPVDAVSGALMLVRRECFEALGGFDPGYRLHCEDLDLCRRAAQAGWGVAVAESVRVLHLKGASSRRRPAWVEWQKHLGMWRYFHKFDAAGVAWPVRIAVPLAIAFRLPFAVARALWRARAGR